MTSLNKPRILTEIIPDYVKAVSKCATLELAQEPTLEMFN